MAEEAEEQRQGGDQEELAEGMGSPPAADLAGKPGRVGGGYADRIGHQGILWGAGLLGSIK